MSKLHCLHKQKSTTCPNSCEPPLGSLALGRWHFGRIASKGIHPCLECRWQVCEAKAKLLTDKQADLPNMGKLHVQTLLLEFRVLQNDHKRSARHDL